MKNSGDSLESGKWEEVPGLEGVLLYPYIRKVDITSSNAYILSFQDAIVVIDPGGIREQAEIILREIESNQKGSERPVFIILSHIHLDHCLVALNHPGFANLPGCFLCAHDRGATSLECGDRKATIADLIDLDFPKTEVDIHLFCRESAESGQEKSTRHARVPLSVLPPMSENIGGRIIDSQIIRLENGDEIEIYHTPGHSPDSICIRAGNILFCGDLPFATAPGIAGITGWDRNKLDETIEGIIAVISDRDIEICLPGHGRPMDVDSTLRILRSIQKEARGLAGIQEINPEWAKKTALFAQSLMSEVDRLFTIIAGRLVYVSHVLEELEERGEAARMVELIDSDLIDELLCDFGRFSDDFQSGNKQEIHLALKAGQIAAKLERLFKKDLLATILDISLIRRIDRLLEDYSLTFRGFEPLVSLECTDIAIAVGDVVTWAVNPPYHDEDIILAPDEEAFARALALRIAWVNLFENTEIDYSPTLALPMALMDRERFEETMIFLLEKVAVAGVSTIHIRTGEDQDRVTIFLEGSARQNNNILDQHAAFFAERSVQLSGGKLSIQSGEDTFRIVFSYPVGQPGAG